MYNQGLVDQATALSNRNRDLNAKVDHLEKWIQALADKVKEIDEEKRGA